MLPVGSPGSAGGVFSASSTVTGSARAKVVAAIMSINEQSVMYFNRILICYITYSCVRPAESPDRCRQRRIET